MTQEAAGDSAQLLMLLPLLNKTIISATGTKEAGFTKSQFWILTALSQREDLTMSQIAGYLTSSKEQATRAVAPLVDNGLVERWVDPKNRTKVHISLTDQGQEFVNQYKLRFRQKVQELIEEKISPQDREELNQALDTLIRILNKMN